MTDNIVDQYQKFTRSTAVYPDNPKHRTQSRCMYLALGLMGEAGEVAEKIKKWYRDGELDKALLEKEMGDVYWYLARLADELAIPSSRVLIKNRDKLIDRQNRDVLKGNGDER